MRMGDETVTDLLEQLSAGRVDTAWHEFLASYGSLIRHVIRDHDPDESAADECFAHVCGALSDDGCRRLRSFRVDGPAQFRSWLVTVVSNLCIDWRRREQGRNRLPRSVSALPELDQQVYRCIYMRRMSRAQCAQALLQDFPGLTESAVAGINARLFALLTPRQRWQLSVRNRPLQQLTAGHGTEEGEEGCQLADPEPGPEEAAEELQDQARLQAALSRLPPDQRLLLRLRYEQNLTLAEVARLTGQADPFRANRRIQAALAALAELLAGSPPGHRRKSD